MHAHKLENQAIEIVGQALTTDVPAAFNKSAMELVGYSMSKEAADKAFAQAGFTAGAGRDLVGVVELHDCFAANEVLHFPYFISVTESSYSAHHIPGTRAMQARRVSQIR